MRRLLLAGATLAAVACASEPPAAVRVPAHKTSAGEDTAGDSRASLLDSPAEPTTTAEVSTTTAVVVGTTEPEPVATTVPYVAPVTTRRAPATTVYEPPSPQSRTVEPAGDIWWQLALCESGGANVDTGNGYSGFFQFMDSTWRSVGYSGRAVDHSYETQVAGARALQARSGWGQWPACSRKLGLR